MSSRRLNRFWIVVALAISVVGCAKTDPPRFRPNRLEMLKSETPPAQQREIALALAAMFGSPDDPFVLPDSGLDLAKIRQAAGPVGSDEQGNQRGLYRRHCVHCHGVTGDGLGPTAAILNPYPRDYRPGVYKYKSTTHDAKPTQADLERVLRDGIMDTAMPSFDLLLPSEINALVEYVKYLSIRGQVELQLIEAAADLGVGESLSLDGETLVEGPLAVVVKSWREAESKVVHPPEPPAGVSESQSAALGREIFLDRKKALCSQCHGASALGDGQVTDYDFWNKKVAETLAANRAGFAALASDQEISPADRAKKLEQLGLMAHVLEEDTLPPIHIRPRNLRRPYYRFGRRPVDLYRRVQTGIDGAQMPASGQVAPGAPGLAPDEVWHVVRYLQTLPYDSPGSMPKESDAKSPL